MSKKAQYWQKYRKAHGDLRNRQRAANYDRGAEHLTIADRQTRRAYTALEDYQIVMSERSDRELAIAMKRSVRGIQIRRCRLLAKANA